MPRLYYMVVPKLHGYEERRNFIARVTTNHGVSLTQLFNDDVYPECSYYIVMAVGQLRIGRIDEEGNCVILYVHPERIYLEDRWCQPATDPSTIQIPFQEIFNLQSIEQAVQPITNAVEVRGEEDTLLDEK